jgi:hypothetical protein
LMACLVHVRTHKIGAARDRCEVAFPAQGARPQFLGLGRLSGTAPTSISE